ncbi:MAG TPA: acyl-CoA dehydrogenase family protein, partial [Acidimicrobiales bacterium]|nr:acyl-CoA dehydrogenase family protein [Acidimicrobiales bacterium]
MDLELSPSQEELVRAFSACLAKESSPERVRQAEPLGFDPGLWRRLADMGVPSLAVPEAAGGGGGGLLEAALVCEAAGRHLAPAPVVESLAAARALAGAGLLAGPAGEGVASGRAVATLALGPGLPQLVPAGAVAEVVVGRQGPDLAVWRRRPPGVAAPNFASLPVAWLEPGPPAATVPGAGDRHQAARDEWLVLAG